jgi:hypothetical protein
LSAIFVNACRYRPGAAVQHLEKGQGVRQLARWVRTITTVVSMFGLTSHAAQDMRSQSPLISTGRNSEEQVVIRLPTQIDGACLSYYAYSTPDQATIIIPWRLLSDLAAPVSARTLPDGADSTGDRSRQARTIIAKADYSKRNYWGCASLDQELGIGASLLFDLLDSGSVVVVNDSLGEPAGEIVIRHLADSRDISSYSLDKKAKPFITKDPQKLTFQAGLANASIANRNRFSIDKEPNDENDQALYGFLRKFIDSCIDPRPETKKYYLSHVGLPLRYKFSVVTDKGKAVLSTGTVAEMKLNATTGGFALPLCMGDGGLEDVVARRKGDKVKVDLTFGSGPNEQLYFSRASGQWRLISAEWIDH